MRHQVQTQRAVQECKPCSLQGHHEEADSPSPPPQPTPVARQQTPEARQRTPTQPGPSDTNRRTTRRQAALDRAGSPVSSAGKALSDAAAAAAVATGNAIGRASTRAAKRAASSILSMSGALPLLHMMHAAAGLLRRQVSAIMCASRISCSLFNSSG